MFFLKAFYWGQKGARENYALQFQNLVEHGYKSLGETPVIIGECGIPMDLKLVFSCDATVKFRYILTKLLGVTVVRRLLRLIILFGICE
jgi:hypothetical protein